MLDREGVLSVRRQCALLGLSRSSVYYRPRGERAENLALMRRMDALSLRHPTAAVRWLSTCVARACRSGVVGCGA